MATKKPPQLLNLGGPLKKLIILALLFSVGAQAEVRESRRVIEKTIDVQTSGYAANDQLGNIFYLTGLPKGGNISLEGITVVDNDSQSASIDFLFFDDFPTVTSSDNGALNIADAQMTDKFISAQKVLTSSYSTLTANSYAYQVFANNNIKLRSNSTALWIQLKAGSNATYSGGKLKFRFHIKDL